MTRPARSSIPPVEPIGQAEDQLSALDGRTAGIAIHQLIGGILAAGLRTPSPIELRRFVAAHSLAQQQAINHRLAARQRLLTAASVYFRLFVLDSEWTFIQAELPLGRRRADIAWQDGEGGVLLDELKSGALADRLERDTLTDQVGALLGAGQAAYGERFVGVRAIVLGAPRSSYLARSDGEREPLQWEERS